MNTYPTTLIQVIGSKESLDDGTVLERSESGKPRLRTFYDQTRNTFTVQHEGYSPEKEALMDFYQANKFSAFNFVWQGNGLTYTCRFINAPQPTPAQGDGYWTIISQLVVV